jgi:phage portal protein BeeE
MARVKTQQVREERWRENYKDDGSSTRMNRLEITEMDHMRFRTT